jgi:hypothetical protein
MEKSNERLEEALYNMGMIYKQQLLDYEESIKAFKELIKRYPDSGNSSAALYYLYELHNNVQKPTEAQYYGSQLSTLFPESHYAKLLNNPNYLKELEFEEQKVVRFYENVYSLYQQKYHAAVIAAADSAIMLFSGDPLLPKFMYIRAMSLGAKDGKESMKVALDTLIARYPSSEESLQAKEIVDYMYVEFPEIKEADQYAIAEEIYTVVDSLQEHYLLLAVQSSQNVNQVRFDLLNYNLDHYNQYDLNIDQIKMVDSYNVLVVKLFSNANAASRYFRDLRANSDSFLAGMSSSQYRMMIISRDNFKTLTERKELIPYYLFFQKHYSE